MIAITTEYEQINESSLTLPLLKSEASNGRFYSYEKHSWQKMEWTERLFRKIFVFADSVETTCLRYSFDSVERMPEFPIEIANNVEYYLIDSLSNKSSLHSSFTPICHIFCRVFGTNDNQIRLEQHAAKHMFSLFQNATLEFLVEDSEFGTFDFSYPTGKKVFRDESNLLAHVNGNRIGVIKLTNSHLELYSGLGRPLAHAKGNNDKMSLVFREAVTNRLVAVANLSKPEGLIHWQITLVDKSFLDESRKAFILLAWAALKYAK